MATNEGATFQELAAGLASVPELHALCGEDVTPDVLVENMLKAVAPEGESLSVALMVELATLSSRLTEVPEAKKAILSKKLFHAFALQAEKHPEEEDLYRAVLEFAYSLCECNSLHVVRHGCIETLKVALSRHAKNERVALAACTLVSQLGLYDVKPLLQDLEALLTQASPELLPKVCWAVGCLADYEKHAVVLLEGSITDKIIEVMQAHNEDGSLQQNTLFALETLCGCDGFKLTPDVVEAIAKAMAQHVDQLDVQKRGVWVLRKLCMHGDTSKRRPLLMESESALPGIIQAAKSQPQDASIQVGVSNAFVCLAFNSEENTAAIAGKGGLEVCIKALDNLSSSPRVMIAACDAISALCYRSLPHSTEVENLSGVTLIVQGMQAFPLDAKLQELGCVAFATLASHQSLREKIANQGAAAMVCTAMRNFSTSASITKNGCRALSLLVANSESNCVEVAQQGGIQCLLSAINAHVYAERTVHHACVALRFLSPRSDENVQVMVNHDAVDIIIATAKSFIDNVSIMTLLARITTNMCSGTVEVSSSPLVATILDAMWEHQDSIDLQIEACRAVASLTYRPDANIGDILLEYQAVDALLNMMSSISPDENYYSTAHYEGLNTLTYLAHTSEALVAEIVNQGGIAIITKTMKNLSTHLKVQITACTALGPLAFRNVDSAREIIANGMIDLIVTAIRNNTSFKLYEVALLLLANLFWHSDLANPESVTEEGIACIIEAMKHSISQHAIQKAACRVLSHLAHNSTQNKTIISQKGGIMAILNSMHTHMDRARNQYHGCAALKNLAWKSDSMTQEIRQKGGIEVVTAVIKSHPQNESLKALAAQVHAFLLHKVPADDSAGLPESAAQTPGSRTKQEGMSRRKNFVPPMSEDMLFNPFLPSPSASPHWNSGMFSPAIGMTPPVKHAGAFQRNLVSPGAFNAADLEASLTPPTPQAGPRHYDVTPKGNHGRSQRSFPNGGGQGNGTGKGQRARRRLPMDVQDGNGATNNANGPIKQATPKKEVQETSESTPTAQGKKSEGRGAGKAGGKGGKGRGRGGTTPKSRKWVQASQVAATE